MFVRSIALAVAVAVLPACEISGGTDGLPYNLVAADYDAELTAFAAAGGAVAPGFPVRVETAWETCARDGIDETTLPDVCTTLERIVSYRCTGVACRIFAADGAPCDAAVGEGAGARHACSPRATVIPLGEGALVVDVETIGPDVVPVGVEVQAQQTLPLLVATPTALTIEPCRPDVLTTCLWWNRDGERALHVHVRSTAATEPEDGEDGDADPLAVALRPTTPTTLRFPPELLRPFSATSPRGAVTCYGANRSRDDAGMDCLIALGDAADDDPTRWTVDLTVTYDALTATGTVGFEPGVEPTDAWCATHTCENPQ